MRVTAPALRAMKAQGRKVVCVTAYDTPTGRTADGAGVDVVLVGDSLGSVLMGRSTTVGVTLEAMAHHVRATRPGVGRALLVADLPFGSYGASVAQAVESAAVLVQAGADAVKLEGRYTAEVEAIAKTGVPVMGHVGMTPQSVNAFGGHRVQGRDGGADIVDDAVALDQAGVFALVIELVTAEAAAAVTQAVACPTIGIGAGPHCDGQIQVYHDLFGLSERTFKHAKLYGDAGSVMSEGMKAYVDEVRNGVFPGPENTF
ncbi:MAG: 3-methyl-2-oxobutanoate hydroxymethyltransferase [Armatimonadetes bacterium]|nr:3-methyl-2-oxobutanoate hydroxymethyltransferase [Armatimonadota bacterium]